MKTFKQFGVMIKGVTFACIFTLHHVSGGLYWAAPSVEDQRKITISLHLPFSIFSISWVIRKKQLPGFKDIIGLYADDD